MKLGIRNRFKRIFLTVIIASLLLSNQVSATELGDEEQALTLEINFKANNTVLVGAEFDIYLVATIDNNGDVKPTYRFGLFEDEINEILKTAGTMDDEMQELTDLLGPYIELHSDRIKAFDSGETNEKGKLVFPTSEDIVLVDGLYLVVGHSLTQDGYLCEPVSFMTFLPWTDSNDVVWRYVRAIPKVDITPPGTPSTPESTPPVIDSSISGDTIGGGGGDEEDEPSLLSDDFPIGEVLSGSVDSAIEGSTEEPTTEPLPTLSGSLPQTGQLWWPIPFLLAGGLILIILGFVLRRTDYEGQ